MKLKDKVIVVTGGSEGLGKAIVDNLVSKNAVAIVVSRNVKKASNAYRCDITDKDQVKETVVAIAAKYGRIDGLINCAGLWLKTIPFEEVDMAEAEKVLDVNLKGTIFVTHEVLPYIKKSKESVLVNVSSKSGTRPMELQSVYCASKYGVKGFTDTLKLELKDSTVKVMGFYPSGMNTQMFLKAGEEFSSEAFMDVTEIAEIITFAIERPGNISIEEIQVDKY